MKEVVTIKNAKLFHGDSLKILPTIESGSCQAVVTDPPYSSGGLHTSDRIRDTKDKYVVTGTKKVAPSFAGDNRDQRSYLTWCTLWLLECYRILAPGSPILVFTDWRQLPTVTDAIQAAGFVWRGVAVWDKTQGVRPNKGSFRQQAEFIVYATKGARPKPAADAPCLPGVFRHAPLSGGGKLHQVGKPVPLMNELIAIAPLGGRVLDPFMGSATTGVAALETKREFIGIEVDNHYWGVCVDRMRSRSGQTVNH